MALTPTPKPNLPRPDESEMDPQTQKLVAVLAQLGSFFFPFLVPIGILLGTQDKFVRDHAREALNFDIALLLYGFLPVVGLVFTTFFVAGEALGLAALVGSLSVAILVFLGVAYVLYPIIGAVKAASGRTYRFPLIIRFFR